MFKMLVCGISLGLFIAVMIISLAGIFGYDMNPSAKASDIYFPDVQHIECKFDYNWSRSGYPLKKLECDITK